MPTQTEQLIEWPIGPVAVAVKYRKNSRILRTFENSLKKLANECGLLVEYYFILPVTCK